MNVVDLRELALQKVKIAGNIIGKFGTFEIEQVYKNDTKNILEVGYTFPIVETATVIGFEIYVGDKVLKGKCKEKEKARKEYQKNIVSGNSAYMLEQKTDNIFKISVGKIDKDEEVTVKIQYIDKFEIVDNTLQVLIPTLVTPKYKSNITSKLSYDDVNYTVDFNINILKTLNIKSINCLSHKIKVIENNESEIVEVLNYDLSKDFKLLIELKNELSSNAITSKTRNGKDMVYLSFMPEILDSYEDSEKEYLFLVDVSGSMMGKKLDETKRAVIECLKQLDVGDRFNIIPFESRFEAMNIRSIEYNEENMSKAEKYVNELQPLGGTEILSPIKFALYEKEREKIILIFTDGQVGNENEIIKFVETNVNRSRIFTFGIDTNVNSSFIKQLAKVGNGKAELIQPNEKIDDKIIRTFARIQTPLLEEVTVDYGKNKVIDEIKEEKSLFNYEFFNVFTKIEKLEDDIQLKGKILSKEYIWKIKKDDIKNASLDLEVLFAKQEIDRLEEYIRNTYDNKKTKNYEKMIIELSEKYNINSKYTSFITIYERERKILEVPRYQETKLSSKFAKNNIMNKLTDLFVTDECFDYDYECDNTAIAPTTACTYRAISNGLDDIYLPAFLRKSSKVIKTNKEKLEEMVDEYYKEFIALDEQPILTFLLYALYYLKNGNYNYEYLLQFLTKHKQEIVEKELYVKLVCLCYENLSYNKKMCEKEILELMNDDFKKIVTTNLKVNIELKILYNSDISEIIKSNKIKENINEIIWYLYNAKRKV